MYCTSCGEKLDIKNQRYCQYCGNKVQISHEITQVSPPVYQSIGQKSVKKGSSGTFSKKTLGFGIVSLVILTITFNIGSTAVLEPIISNIIPLRRIFTGLIIAHVIGIMFGTASRIYYRKAEEMEPSSTILKAGNIIGFIGIIFNAILMIIAIIVVGIST